MAGYGRATAEALATLGQALKTQSDAVDHGTHFNSGDIPSDWDPNFGQFVPCPKSLKPVRGVIAYLRQLAGDKKPFDCWFDQSHSLEHLGRRSSRPSSRPCFGLG